MRPPDVPTTAATAHAEAAPIFPIESCGPNRFISVPAQEAGGFRGHGLTLGLIAVALLTGATPGLGMDWPQYRGPNHDGISPDRIVKDWPAEGPRQVWRINLTDGFSSFAVSGGKAFTLDSRQLGGVDQEFCVALNAATGQELWATPLGLADYQYGADIGDGPRSTPTIDGDRVYTSSVDLSLACLEADTGKVLWRKDLVTEHGAQNIPWQNAASPLIDGDLLFVNCNAPGRTLLALRKTDGSLAWQSGTDRLTQATPVAATILGVRQVIFFTQSGLVSVVPATGTELWRYAFLFSTSTAASPVVAGDIVFCSAAYGVGAGAVKVSKSGDAFTAAQLWRVAGNKVGNHWSTAVYHAGYVYGLFGSYDNVKLKCLELATGLEKWAESGFGPGGVVVVDDHLLILSDTGALVLVQTDPSAYTEVARTQAVTGKCWNVPAVSDGRIYARSTSEAVCLDVSVPPPPPLRVQSATLTSGGSLQLSVVSSDGAPLDASRVARIQLRVTADLSVPLTQWDPVSTAGLLENGVLRFEDADPGVVQQRFYAVVEQP